MKIPTWIQPLALCAASVVLLLIQAGAAGYQLACAQLRSTQLTEAHQVLQAAAAERQAASDDRSATRSARDRAAAALDRAEAILDSAAAEQRRQAERLERGSDAAEMSRL